MVTPKTGRPLGRPLDTDKVDAIVTAGWTLFLKNGVEGVAVEAIAAKANVSKATLYKHFPDKAALFEAGVLREMQRIEAAQGLTAGDRANASLKERLRQFGLGIMSFLVSDHAVDFYSALAGELRRHPELARRFYDKGPGRTRANLSRIIAQAVAAGELNVHDPDEAADQLFGLWQGMSNFQLSLGVKSDEVRHTLAKRVDSGIGIFLRAHGTKRKR